MKKLLLLSLVIGLALQLYCYQTLPEEVASTFGKGGAPTGWLSREAYLFFTLLAIGCNSLIFLFIDKVLSRVDPKYVNFPYKQFWLTQERRTLAFEKMAQWTDFFGIVVNIYLAIVFYLVYRANLLLEPQLDNSLFIPLLLLFMAILVGWVIAIYVHFRPSKHSGQPQ